MEITLKIGDVSQTYHAIETTAPESYDFNDTLRLYTYEVPACGVDGYLPKDQVRLVLVPVESTGQVPRYWSGTYSATKPGERMNLFGTFLPRDIERMLWNRLAGVPVEE